MIKQIAVAAGLLIAGPALAANWTYPEAVRACDNYAETQFCVGHNGCPNWSWMSACVVGLTDRKASQGMLDFCVNVEARKRVGMCAMCGGDPVAEVVACVRGRR